MSIFFFFCVLLILSKMHHKSGSCKWSLDQAGQLRKWSRNERRMKNRELEREKRENNEWRDAWNKDWEFDA